MKRLASFSISAAMAILGMSAISTAQDVPSDRVSDILLDKPSEVRRLDADLAVRAAAVRPDADQRTRDLYDLALDTWADEHRFDEVCDDHGFALPPGTHIAFPCFTAAPYVVVRGELGMWYFIETPKSATRLYPRITDTRNFRYLDINALVKAAR